MPLKRKIIIAVLIVLSLAVVVVLLPSKSPPNAPRFVPAPPGFKVGEYTGISYQFLQPAPFVGGVMWITLYTKPGYHSYLYDIERRKVLGELTNGWPIFGNRDQSKVLLDDNHPSPKERLLDLLDRATRGKLNLSARNREESFAVLDLKLDESQAVGRLYQVSGAGSRWYPSPTFRHGFTRPTVNSGVDVFVCDLEKDGMRRITMHGLPVGWWNETSILYKTKNHDLALYDVGNDQTSILLQAEKIREFLKQNDLSADLSRDDVKPFPMWDGKQYQFYFTDTYKRWEATNSFLAKIERPSGQLKLIAADFRFDWSDSFDPSGRFYVYSGRDHKAGDKVSAVYVRDLQTGTTRTLVEDGGAPRHSIPLWYGNDVIYSRSNMLWRIGLSDTNAIRVFPPDE